MTRALALACALTLGCRGPDRDRERARDVATTAPRPGMDPDAARLEPELTPTQAKAHRLALALAELDPSLHAIRIGWTGEPQRRWSWPVWVKLDKVPELLAALDELAAWPPALPDADAAVRAYVERTRADLAALDRAVRGWNTVEADPSAPAAPDGTELVALFERLGATSAGVLASLRPYRVAEAPRGSRHAVEDACVRVGALLARLPGRVAEQVAPTTFAWPPDRELAAAAATCMRASIDYLELPDPDTYRAQLAVGIGMGMFRTVADRKANRITIGGTVGTIAQQTSYLAAMRRREDRQRRGSTATD